MISSDQCIIIAVAVTAALCYLGERGDEAGDADKSSICEEFGHLSDAADVLLAVSGAEAQVFIQAVSDIIAIQRVTGDSMRDQILL